MYRQLEFLLLSDKSVEKLLFVDCCDSNGEELGCVERILALAPRRPMYCSASVHDTKSLGASSIRIRFVVAVFPEEIILLRTHIGHVA